MAGLHPKMNPRPLLDMFSHQVHCTGSATVIFSHNPETVRLFSDHYVPGFLSIFQKMLLLSMEHELKTSSHALFRIFTQNICMNLF